MNTSHGRHRFHNVLFKDVGILFSKSADSEFVPKLDNTAIWIFAELIWLSNVAEEAVSSKTMWLLSVIDAKRSFVSNTGETKDGGGCQSY